MFFRYVQCMKCFDSAAVYRIKAFKIKVFVLNGMKQIKGSKLLTFPFVSASDYGSHPIWDCYKSQQWALLEPA